MAEWWRLDGGHEVHFKMQGEDEGVKQDTLLAIQGPYL